MPNLHQRATAAYLGLAVGDALGATVEFMTPREITAQYGTHRHIVGGGWLRLKPGQVTDDTTMALALGDAILACQGRVESLAAANAFDQWMRNKPVDIGNTVRRGIIHFRTTGEPQMPLNEHDAGNGAAMRVLPVALATFGAHPRLIREAVLTQAHVTHNHPLSDAGTLCIVEMIHAAFNGAGPPELLHGPVSRLTTAHPEFDFKNKRAENPSGFIVHTLHAVFQALFDTDNFENCLVDTVNRGGDADTTGAIAGMIAGALYGPAAIPVRWRKALHPETRTHCEIQAHALTTLANTTIP